MKRLPLTALSFACLLAASAPAWAQGDDTGSPLDIPGEDSGGDMGQGTDSGQAPEPASASGEAQVSASATGAAGLGVGVLAMLSGPVGASVVYDPGQFHVEGILGFASDGETDIDIGGRFFYHLHSSQAADFSLGGGLGIQNVNPDMGDSTTNIDVDVGAEVRLFLVPNVALSSTIGLAIVTGDGDLVALRGQLLGDIGVTYFF